MTPQVRVRRCCNKPTADQGGVLPVSRGRQLVAPSWHLRAHRARITQLAMHPQAGVHALSGRIVAEAAGKLSSFHS